MSTPGSNCVRAVWPLLVALLACGASGCDAHAPDETSGPKGGAQPPESESADDATAGPVRPVQGPELPEEFRSSEMRLPRSTAVVPWKPEQDAVQIVATAKEIRVAGEHIVDLPLQDEKGGDSDEDSDGGAEDFAISAVQSALEEIHQPSSESGDEAPLVHLAVDRSTPYDTVTQLMYTAGQAGLPRFLVVVFGEDGRRAYEIHLTRPKPEASERKEPPPKPENEEGRVKKPLDLTIHVEEDGILVGATGVRLPPQKGCPKPGPTLCLSRDDIDIETKVERARELARKNSSEARDRAARHFREIERAYDWRGLYEKLLDIKEKYPEETVFKVLASPDLPFYLVVRAMDVARFKLKRRNFEDPDAYWNALWHGPRRWRAHDNGMVREELFSRPIFAIAK